jgi:hypothetical protein
MTMSDLDKAVQTQLNNIQQKTGKSLDELAAIVAASGLTKHGEIRGLLMNELGYMTPTPWCTPSDNRTGRAASRRPALRRWWMRSHR